MLSDPRTLTESLIRFVVFRSYSSTRLFTLSTSFNEKNEQDDKQAQRSVHLESQSSLTMFAIVDALSINSQFCN